MTPEERAQSVRWRIEDVLINPRERTVLRGDREVSMEPRAFDVLQYLFWHSGRVVSREELLDAVWPHRVVTDDAVYRAIRLARSAFGPRGSEIIKTVHGRGYRLAETPIEEPATQRDPERRAADSISRRWLGFLAAALVIAALLVTGVLRQQGSDEPVDVIGSHGGTTVAVLPFDVEDGGRSIDYLGVELAAELRGELRRMPGLRVLGRATTLAVAEQGLISGLDGGVIGATRIVSGRLRASAETITVAVEVRDQWDGHVLGAEELTWPRGELPRLKAVIAERVAESLRVAPQMDTASPLQLRSTAYELFLEARHLWRSREPAALDRAAGLLLRALDVAPGFARGYEALAAVYLVMPSWQVAEGDSARSRAYSAAREALRLDPELGEARAILAEEARAAGHWSEAEALFERALEHEPHNPTVVQWYAEFLLMRGELERAAVIAQKAVALDPMSAIARTVRAWSAVIGGDDETALEQAGQAVSLGMPSSNIIIAWSQHRRGNDRAAAEALGALLEPTAAVDRCREALHDPDALAGALEAIVESPRRDQLALIYHLVCLAMLGAGDTAPELFGDRTPGIEFAILWATEFKLLRHRPGFPALSSEYGFDTIEN